MEGIFLGIREAGAWEEKKGGRGGGELVKGDRKGEEGNLKRRDGGWERNIGRMQNILARKEGKGRRRRTSFRI